MIKNQAKKKKQRKYCSYILPSNNSKLLVQWKSLYVVCEKNGVTYFTNVNGKRKIILYYILKKYRPNTQNLTLEDESTASETGASNNSL